MVKCKVLVPTGTFFLKSPFVTFVHNHIQCLMTTQDFRILKGKGIQGIFGYWGKFFPQRIKILVSTER